jgi:hypothetical protein
MMEDAGKPGARHPRMAAPDQVRYIEVKVPVRERAGRHQVSAIVVSDFDAP